MKWLTNLDLNRNQILNAVFQNLSTAPSTPVEGLYYYNTVDHKLYYYNGSEWVAAVKLTGDDIIGLINNSSLLIDNDNLSASVNSAITNSHTHSNKAILDAITASYTTEEKTKLGGIEASADVTDATNVGTAIHGTTAKDALVDADELAIINSAASNILAKVTWASFKTILKAYTDTLYVNTSNGTTSETFTIGDIGVKIKNASGTELQVRNNGDTEYADLRVKNLVVEGTTTTVNSEEVNLADNIIVLNSNISTNAENDTGGIAVKRLMADNTTRKDAELTYNTSSEKWQTTFGVVSGTLVTAQVANKITANIGDGVNNSFVITHNLNSRDLNVSIREAASPYALVFTDVEFTSLSTLTVKFAIAPTSSQYVITIIG